MKGNNTMTVCPALMNEIVQEWIDRNVVSKPEVKSVVHTNDGFKIGLSEKASEPVPPPEVVLAASARA